MVSQFTRPQSRSRFPAGLHIGRFPSSRTLARMGSGAAAAVMAVLLTGGAASATTGCYPRQHLEFAYTSEGQWRHYRGGDFSVQVMPDPSAGHADMWLMIQHRNKQGWRIDSPWRYCDAHLGCLWHSNSGWRDQQVRVLYRSSSLPLQVDYDGEVRLCSSW